MQRPRDRLVSRPGLSDERHGCAQRRDAIELAREVRDGRSRAQHVGQSLPRVAEGLQLSVACEQTRVFGGHLHRAHEHLGRERQGQNQHRARLSGCVRAGQRARWASQDDAQLRSRCAERRGRREGLRRGRALHQRDVEAEPRGEPSRACELFLTFRLHARIEQETQGATALCGVSLDDQHADARGSFVAGHSQDDGRRAPPTRLLGGPLPEASRRELEGPFADASNRALEGPLAEVSSRALGGPFAALSKRELGGAGASARVASAPKRRLAGAESRSPSVRGSGLGA